MGKGRHPPIDPTKGQWRLGAAIAVNMALTVAQVIGGVLSGSLALIADALHNLSDAISLAIAYFARRIARRPADAAMTFGYARAEVVAALVNYTTLIVVGFYLAAEGVQRLFAPQPVEGWTVVVVAGIAFAVDAATVLLTFAGAKSSMNIRAAFLHNIADTMSSVAVILAGTLILLYDWQLVDPIVTLFIAGTIIVMSLRQMGGAIRILMLGAPPGSDVAAILSALARQSGVESVHHVHLWQMQEHETALDAHIVIDRDRWQDADAIKAELKAVLARFGVAHATLELECALHACADPQVIGHA